MKTLWTLGYPDQALKWGNEGVALAEGMSHPHSLAFAEMYLGFLHQYRREARAAQQRAEIAIALCAEYGFTGLFAFLSVLRGGVIVEQGRTEEGIAQMQEGLAALHATGTALARPSLLTRLAEAYMQAGRDDEGLRALAEAVAAGFGGAEQGIGPLCSRDGAKLSKMKGARARATL